MDPDEKIIYLVQKYDCLFNVKAKGYSDKNLKINAWEKVRSEMNLPVAECQKRWKRIRDCYKKALRVRKFKSGSARTICKSIKFEEELNFLKPFLQDKPQTSNLDSSEDILDIATDTDDSSCVSPGSINREILQTETPQLSNPTPRNKSQPLSQLLYRQYLELKQKEEDPVDGFFLSMSRTVKKMPTVIQAELKRAILGLVTDAEIKLAVEGMNDSPTSRPPETAPRSLYIQSTSTYTPSNMYSIQPNSSIAARYSAIEQSPNSLLIHDTTSRYIADPRTTYIDTTSEFET